MSSKQGIRMIWLQNDEGRMKMGKVDGGHMDDSSRPRRSVIDYKIQSIVII